MLKYSISISIICSFLISSCDIYSKKPEAVTKNVVSSEIQIPIQNTSPQTHNCDALNNGVPSDKLFNFSYKYTYQHADYDYIFITCLDKIESEINKNYRESNDGTNIGDIQSLVFMKKESYWSGQYSSIIRLPFFWTVQSGDNYVTNYNTHKYILAFSSDFKNQHIIDLDPHVPEQTKIVHTFLKDINVQKNIPQGILYYETYEPWTLKFFSFQTLEEIVISSDVLTSVPGIYNKEWVVYFVKNPKFNLKKGEIEKFNPRNFTIELSRYTPSKNISEWVKKISVPTSYQKYADLGVEMGEYLNLGDLLVIENPRESNIEHNDILFLGGKIIFE